MYKNVAHFLLLLCFVNCILACSGGEHSEKLGESSEPINSIEERRYKQAMIRCAKTGGTRVVKIAGILKCY